MSMQEKQTGPPTARPSLSTAAAADAVRRAGTRGRAAPAAARGVGTAAAGSGRWLLAKARAPRLALFGTALLRRSRLGQNGARDEPGGQQ